MRSKILVVITTVLLFGVGFAVYAYNSTQSITETVAASCCSCCGDSCPMKAKGDKALAEAGANCCCCGDSCPMKAKGDKASAEAGANCCCCGDSCPMKAKRTAQGMDTPPTNGGQKAEQNKGENQAPSTAGLSCPCCSKGKEAKRDKAI